MSTTLPAKRTPIPVNVNAPGSFFDQIKSAGRAVDMTGATVKFYVRPFLSRIPSIVNGLTAHPIAPPDAEGNNVRYDWQTADVSGGDGEVFAWWNFTVSGGVPKETPEFPMLFTDHGPGLATQTGAIVEGTYAFMPITINALRNDSRFGDKWLQQGAEVAKYRLLGYTVAADAEQTLHVLLLDYLSKRLALALVKPAIDYWSRQQRTSTSTQTSEVTAYPDIIKNLQDLGTRLKFELPQDWRDLRAFGLGLPERRVMSLPVSTLGDPSDPRNRHITRSPSEMPPLKTGGYGFQLEFGVWPP